MAAAAGEDIRPGMVAVLQSFGSKINFHPHVHAIVSRGGWNKAGQWVAVPYVDAKAAELLLRHKVVSLLRRAGVIDEERIALLLSWKHSGFSVHNAVTVEPADPGATERLVRYVMRSPSSQPSPRSRIGPARAESAQNPFKQLDGSRLGVVTENENSYPFENVHRRTYSGRTQCHQRQRDRHSSRKIERRSNLHPW